MRIKKFYESVSEIEIGDYVICIDSDRDPDDENDFQGFLDENVGQIIDISKNENGFFQSDAAKRFSDHMEKLFLIYFETKLPEYMNEPDFPKNTLVFLEEEIEDYSKSKEKLELKLAAKKYNL